MTTLKEWMDEQWRNPGVQYAGHGVVYESGGNSGPPRTRAGTERAPILEGNAMTERELIKALVASLRTFSDNVPENEKQWTSLDEETLVVALRYLEESK